MAVGNMCACSDRCHKLCSSGFIKRDGRPKESETLISRLVDRSLRPVFAKGWAVDTQVWHPPPPRTSHELHRLPVSWAHVVPNSALPSIQPGRADELLLSMAFCTLHFGCDSHDEALVDPLLATFLLYPFCTCVVFSTAGSPAKLAAVATSHKCIHSGAAMGSFVRYREPDRTIGNYSCECGACCIRWVSS